MGLTVFPVVTFNATSGGSDTQASGAGPATALYGSAGAVTSASTSATIDASDNVDLTAASVAQDGSAVFFIATASGRQFSRISSYSGSAGAGWTLVLEDSVWTSSTGKAWAIGGKRSTFNNNNSRTLFGTGAKGGWIIQTETDQTLNSVISLSAAGTASTNLLTIRGTSASSQPTVFSSTNASAISLTGDYCVFENLKFANTYGSTKTVVYGITVANGIRCFVRNCVFGDSTNTLNNGLHCNNNSVVLRADNCEFKYCTVNGIYLASFIEFVGTNCYIHNNAVGLYTATTTTGVRVSLRGCVISANTSYGVQLNPSNASNMIEFVGNTIHGNSADGIILSGLPGMNYLIAHSNNITLNTGYGINAPSGADYIKAFVDYNNFGYGAGVTANSSGGMLNITSGSHDLNVDPGYVNASAGNFMVTNPALSAKGYPDSTLNIGAGQTASKSYVDIGLQRTPIIVYPSGGQLML